MAFIEDLRKAFDVKKDHTPKVILVGATDKSNFEPFYTKSGLGKELANMDETASSLGLTYTPLFVLVNEGPDGHLDIEISVPTQQWSAGLRVESTVRASKDLQRISDWCAGFMEVFCMNDSISALDIATGSLLVGDPAQTEFHLDNIMRDLRPKKDKAELMTDSMDIGSVDDILAGQLTNEEVAKLMGPKKELKGLQSVEFARTEMKKQLPARLAPVVDEIADEDLKKTQQEIVDKYGFKALQELLKTTKQPLLVSKPKKP